MFTGCLLALRKASAKGVENELVCSVPLALSHPAVSMPPRLQLTQVESRELQEHGDGRLSIFD